MSGRTKVLTVSASVLLLIATTLLATRTTAERAKTPALSILPMSIQSLSISDDSPAGIYWRPNDQKSVLSQVISWLKTATPYTEIVPQSQEIVFYANTGPSILHITTSEKREIMIYPAWYIKSDGLKVNAYSVVHYVQDVVAFKSGDQITYLVSAPLYSWLKTDQWKTEFVRE